MHNNQLVNMPFLALLLLLALRDSLAYPNGAPNTKRVCRNLQPHHLNARPQETTPPYLLVLDKLTIPSGTAVNITITAKPNFLYKGFVLQARSVTSRHQSPGTFTILDPTQAKIIDCLGLDNGTVTHTSPALKTKTPFVWTPRANFKGQVHFHSTIVMNYHTFWTNVTAILNVGYYDDKDIYRLETEQQLVADSSAEERDDDTGLNHRTVYDQCGVTKVCLGVPDGCVATRSCDAVVTVTARKSQYEFELLGASYVAVSLSENGDLNVDSVTECVMADDAVVRLYQASNESSKGYLRHSPGRDLKEISSSYWDGMVYCKFVRNDKIVINGVRFDFKRKKYFILLTSEHTSEDTGDVKFDDINFRVSEQRNYLSNVTGFCLSAQPKHYFPIYWGMGRSIFEFVFGVFRFILKVMKY